MYLYYTLFFFNLLMLERPNDPQKTFKLDYTLKICLGQEVSQYLILALLYQKK